MKIVYFDTETTGLDPVKNDIVQLSGVIEIDGEEKEVFNFKCQPYSFDNISDEALKVHGMSKEILLTFELPQIIQHKFVDLLGKYCDKFDKTDKYYPAGYNVSFDVDFLAQWFKKAGDNYLGSWLNWKKIDPFLIMTLIDSVGGIKLENYKLETVCKYYNIIISAHDAMSDIMATRKLFQILVEKIGVDNLKKAGLK